MFFTANMSNGIDVQTDVHSIKDNCFCLIYFKAHLHLRARFGPSCAVKYPFGVNTRLFSIAIFTRKTTLQYNRS